MKQPNLFLIGAMRSGSTTLHLLLDQHPEIFMSPIKEPMFYTAEEMRRQVNTNDIDYSKRNSKIREFVERGKYRERHSYEGLFKNSRSAKYIGESSHYINHPQVAKTIHMDCPNAKIVVSLRNPVSRLYSEYLYYRRTNRITLSFDEFAREGCSFDDSGNLVRIGSLSRIPKGFYDKLLQPWLDVFGTDHVKVILYETLIKDPIRVVRSIYQWLDLDASFIPLPVHAQQGGIRRTINPLSVLDGGPAIRLLKRQIPKLARERLRTLIYSVFLKKEKIDTETEAFLKSLYFSHIEELEEILNLELDNWK